MKNIIHIVKLSVGTESIDSLRAWQKSRAAAHPKGLPFHITRMWPKREDEILAGGSVYWVIKGSIQARQRVLGFEELIGEDGIRRCAFLLDPQIIRTAAALKRPFQGWRYLKPEDAPIDLAADRATEEALPAELAGALADIGVL
ncbi:DUF1489 domain-containing protein [uncultured Lentibacter sp.]|uniref:DUF1489 family protein n=1 Tax=uncultured Lentibacter sp. TaxID=1659309 RepID=UPI00262A0458|nr:DUF1489 domain-containing protein [uncultured Lentibacter sp.]MCW1956819.1 DUF1489 domain-containing protein [Roseobacter sp.]